MYYAETIIKNALSQCQGMPINPLNPSDICLDKIKSTIPNDELLYVLHNICSDKKEDKIFSIAQDIISVSYNCSVVKLEAYTYL